MSNLILFLERNALSRHDLIQVLIGTRLVYMTITSHRTEAMSFFSFFFFSQREMRSDIFILDVMVNVCGGLTCLDV